MQPSDANAHLELNFSDIPTSWTTSFFAIPVPENSPGLFIPVTFTIRTTKNPASSVTFNRYGTIIPELLTLDKQSVACQSPRVEAKTGLGYPLIKAQLLWRDEKLHFEVLTAHVPSFKSFDTNCNYLWSFVLSQAEKYQLRFLYDNRTQGELQPTDREDLQKELLMTQPVELRLVRPVGLHGSAIEVDGIRFETLLSPERVKLSTQKGVEVPFRLGLRVTNQTSNSYHFIFFMLMPQLQKANGQMITRGYLRNATRLHQESDYLLAMPKESLETWLDATITKTKRGYYLSGREGSGGVWGFYELQPGSYRVRFIYHYSQSIGWVFDRPRRREVCDDVWVGTVFTPFLEFQLL